MEKKKDLDRVEIGRKDQWKPIKSGIRRTIFVFVEKVTYFEENVVVSVVVVVVVSEAGLHQRSAPSLFCCCCC